MKINVLPQSIANMIAAGEVVERPASVVKELAENSVDAGAKSITIEIKKGGMSYIRVTDDGCGIAPDEVLVAFQRHATSKIKTEEDLNTIYTLGFRGEALASIAAVARVDIFTKPKEFEIGCRASIEGGEVTECGEAGCPDGTTITIRDLFFNTPARMKFLKSDATETSYVTDIVHKLILSHPEVSVKYIVNGKITLSSTGDGDVLNAVKVVFGRDYILHMNEISYEEDGIKIKGYTGTNALARKDRRQQVFFINGRYVKSKIISASLNEAYQNIMMTGKFPVAVISVEISPSFVDVNVHPTKTEVRFSDDKKIYNSVFWAVKNALSAKKFVPQIEIDKSREIRDTMNVKSKISKEQNKAVQVDINLLKDTYIEDFKPQIKEENKIEKSFSAADDFKKRIEENTFFGKADLQNFKSSLPNEPAIFNSKEKYDDELKTSIADAANENVSKSIEAEKAKEPKLRANMDFVIVGQIFNTYIIVQKDDTMLIIDQHAAHERIYFEELVAQYKAKDIKSQFLLMPCTVDFDPVHFEIACANFEILSDLGFECEPFGAQSIIVRAVPSVMANDDVKDTLTEVVSLIEKGTVDIEKTIMEDILHTMACKRALKGNTKIGTKEMEELCQKVLSFESINTCPHGRPIITSMTKYELEKNFKRIV